MHTQQLHFLGWDGPIAEKVAGWLLDGRAAASPVDLQDTLIVVPTLQAGRRLKEVLALRCRDRKTVLLSATLVTPHYFFARPPPDVTPANPPATLAAWTHVLRTADLSRFSAFFPKPRKPEEADRFPWALSTAAVIERLRQELTDGGYRIRDVITKLGDQLQETDRWNDLAGLEDLYLETLRRLHLADACQVKIGLADAPALDASIRRIVVAGVPDPTLLALRALGNLARDRSVDILVHAPENRKKDFDAWGRPVPGVWAKEDVDVPDWNSNVSLEASPAAQAAKIREILTALPETFGPADIGIGVPDVSVIPFLQKELSALRLSAFDPSNARFEAHALGRLVEAMFHVFRSRSYPAVADLLRHPDFLGYVCAAGEIGAHTLLSQLDEFQNYYLPADLDGLLTPFQGNPAGAANQRQDFSALGKALGIVRSHVEQLETRPLEEAWRSFLQSVYERKTVRADRVPDREFQEAAGIVEQTFREFRDLTGRDLGLDGRQASALFVGRLQEQSYHRERADEIIDLQGWLELPWTDTPFLAVAGLNEEFVPGGSLSDVFLPDSLRKALTLRDDLSRFSRDVFLFKGLVESRRAGGRLCLFVGKYSMTGDPLRPSRLLFRCPDADLPRRAGELFKTVAAARPAPAADRIFRLKPAPPDRPASVLEDRVISVTAFRDYLACPFRFYLRHVLDMEALSDEKRELDALDFGLIVHESLRVMGADKALWGCRDAEKLGRKLAELAAGAMARRYGRDPPLAVQVSLGAAQARLKQLAREQARLVAEGWEILATEQSKKLVVDGMTIRGKIDRIDRKGDCIRIIDYKTSDKAKSPADVHLCRRDAGASAYNRLDVPAGEPKKGKAAKQKQWKDLQLPLYVLLQAGRLPACGDDVQLAYFNLPKAVDDTGLSVWEKFDAATLESAVACIRGVVADIAARRFWPPAESVEHDGDFERLFLDAPDRVFEKAGFSP
ncbi:MAG: PD-(D/E)XK nuclease family protein [Lentisphaerae bacterium]|nr:PD-(D/E)XK nuclease family protein [Lentisphaerota bacterium]